MVFYWCAFFSHFNFHRRERGRSSSALRFFFLLLAPKQSDKPQILRFYNKCMEEEHTHTHEATYRLRQWQKAKNEYSTWIVYIFDGFLIIQPQRPSSFSITATAICFNSLNFHAKAISYRNMCEYMHTMGCVRLMPLRFIQCIALFEGIPKCSVSERCNEQVVQG